MKSKNSTSDGHPTKQPDMNPDMNRSFLAAIPQKKFRVGKRMAFVLIASIIASEALIMFIVPRFQIKSEWIVALVDSLLLAILIFPAICFLVIRPFTIQTIGRKQAEDTAHYSLSLMEATIESIHNGILVISSEGAVIKTNAKFAEMWRIPAELIVLGEDKTLLDYVFGQLVDPAGFIGKITELYAKPEAESLDLIDLLDGRIFERISKPMYLGGRPKGRVWSFLDITERFVAEKKLLDSKAHLHTLVQTIPDLVWLKDPSSRYLACNQMFERLVGAKEADIFGKSDFDLFSKENAEFFRENDRKSIAARKPTSNEEWLTFADDGHQALIDVIKTPMYDPKGALIGVLGIGHDITARKRMEEALREGEDKFTMAFQLSPNAITITRAKDGRFIEINDAFTSLSGFTREEALADSSVGLKLWANIDDRNQVVSALFEGKEVAGKEFQFIKKNGEKGTGLFSAQVICLNKESFILSSINDITYRKQSEDALQESEEKYRYMFDNNPQPMWIYDYETLNFLEVNQAAVDHYGYTREEFKYETTHSFICLSLFYNWIIR